MDLQKRFENFIQEKHLVAEGDKILLAVSGGVDSVVMAELFHRSKIKFGIAHCNFQLRGEESEADERFVKKLALKYGVAYFFTRFETDKSSEAYRLSVQETARKLRYDWFASLLVKNNYRSIATAHHLNDSIETFFINLLRGTGVSGLRGIPPILKFPRTIRPLLFAKKAELEKFAREQAIPFRLDHSNESDLYLRNRIRHHLMPVLLQLNPQFENVMENNLRNLAFAERMLDERVLSKYLSGYDPADENAVLPFELKDLRKNEFPLEVLMAIVQSFGFNSTQVEDIWNAKIAGKQVFSGNFVLTSDRKKIILSRKKSGILSQHLITSRNRTLRVSGDLRLSLNSKRQAKDAKHVIPAGNNWHVLDKEKLEFPLTLRKWEKGDYFFPLGMTRRKKISDFLIDRKVSRPDKEKTYVLLSGGNIICVLGHRIDNRYRVTDKTRVIYQIELIQNDKPGETGV